MRKLTKVQINFLQILQMRPHGAVIRGRHDKRVLSSLVERGLAQETYEMPSGGIFACITKSGRQALEQSDASPPNGDAP